MEFIVNESACRQLSVDMLTDMKNVALLIAEINNQNSNLMAALGDDYQSINRSVQVMASEFADAQHELDTIIRDMNEYMARVGQARVALN